MPKRLLVGLVGLTLALASPALAVNPDLGCYVDTAAYDLPTFPNCSGPGGASNSTTFVVADPPANYSLSWIPGCLSSSANWCMQTILPGQCRTQKVVIVDLSPPGNSWTQTSTACRDAYEPPEW